MKTAIYFIFTCLVSTGALLGALSAGNPFPAFGVAFGIRAWFLWRYHRRCKKEADRRYRERLFEHYMRERHRY